MIRLLTAARRYIVNFYAVCKFWAEFVFLIMCRVLGKFSVCGITRHLYCPGVDDYHGLDFDRKLVRFDISMKCL